MSREDLFAHHAMLNMTNIVKSKIKKINKTKYKGLVFNLEVKKNQNYFANFILVHNCHEKSNPNGKHANLDKVDALFKGLPGGEIACGGGNTLSHPEIIPFLQIARNNNLVPNITVNQYHFTLPILQEIINRNLVGGVGCSVTDMNSIRNILYNGHIVFHLIAGIHTVDDVKRIIEQFPNPRILILGYKIFGNGINYYSKNKKEIDKNIYRWKVEIWEVFGKCTLSFDNLAIQQLNPQRFFTEKSWNTLYQGDDTDGNLYVDLVNWEFAPSSRSPKKQAIPENSNIKDLLKYVRSL